MKRSRVWALSLALALIAGAVYAQRPGGGPGGGGPGGGGRRGFGGRRDGGMMGMLRIPQVQKELKLSKTQIDRLTKLAAAPAGPNRQSFEGLRSLPQDQREKRLAELRAQREKARAEQEKKIVAILQPQQLKRLRQLQLQQAGLRALGRKEVADQLKLTADQRQKVKAALDAERAAMRAAFQGSQGGQPTPAQREQARKKSSQARAAAEAKLNAILTAAQKKQFAGMKGAPFKFPERPQPTARRT
jgi:hypothetical protein